jgi:hypothetical protein
MALTNIFKSLLIIALTSSFFTLAQPICNLAMPNIDQVLKILASDISEADRYSAALCLETIATNNASLNSTEILKISELLNDRNTGVQVIAANSLARLGRHAKIALPALKAALKSRMHPPAEQLGPSVGSEFAIQKAISEIEMAKQ